MERDDDPAQLDLFDDEHPSTNDACECEPNRCRLLRQCYADYR